MSERKLGYWEDKVRKIDMQIQNEGKKMILNIKNILFIICFNNLETEIEELEKKGIELQKELEKLVRFRINEIELEGQRYLQHV